MREDICINRYQKVAFSLTVFETEEPKALSVHLVVQDCVVDIFR